MLTLTEQERADLDGMMRVNFRGGKLAYYVLVHFCMGRILGEADRSIEAHAKALGNPELSDEDACKVIDSAQRIKDARKSLVKLILHLDKVLSETTGISNPEVVRLIGELANPHHAPDCACGMHGPVALEQENVG